MHVYTRMPKRTHTHTHTQTHTLLSTLDVKKSTICMQGIIIILLLILLHRTVRNSRPAACFDITTWWVCLGRIAVIETTMAPSWIIACMNTHAHTHTNMTTHTRERLQGEQTASHCGSRAFCRRDHTFSEHTQLHTRTFMNIETHILTQAHKNTQTRTSAAELEIHTQGKCTPLPVNE